jgi:hypothetical protein
MQLKDYLTLLVSLLSLAFAAWTFFLNRRTMSSTDAVAVVSRKNEIVNEYQGLLILNAEYRFYTGQLAAILSAMGAGDDPAGYADATSRMRENAALVNQTDRIANASIARVRDFDPAEVAANPKARELLEELHGRAKQLTIKLRGNVEDLKRNLEKVSGSNLLVAG